MREREEKFDKYNRPRERAEKEVNMKNSKRS